VGIGTSSPAYKLHTAGIIGTGLTGTNGSVAWKRSSDGAEIATIATDGTTFNYNSGIQHVFKIASTEAMRIDSSGNLLFNSGYGSVATAYGCRAWVNFNGTGTVAIRASGNVSSITDNGTGDYTVNFTTAMPDANYSVSALSQRNFVAGQIALSVIQSSTSNDRLTTSAVRVFVTDQAVTALDPLVCAVSIFR
jgi:hypothetical protein